ncbi:MAG: DnaJ domain-containing protein [Gammaproteobacteria bacterium]|nr:DnaJ domain-containing protein [Gammaproteobacteria bacterium]
MKRRRTYYQVLFVRADAPQEIIKSSYRTLMQQLNAHPDRGGDADEAALINRAYAVLTDAGKREAYDRELRSQYEAAVAAREQTRTAAPLPQVGTTCPFCSSTHPHKKGIPADAVCVTCESPLSLAGREHVDVTGLRKTRRIDKRSKLLFYVRWPQTRPGTGFTSDISPRGIMFETVTELPVGSILKIECSRFSAIAHVVNCRDAGKFLRPNWKIGVQFVTLRFKSSRGTFVSDLA